jgi:hypothetical protein
VVKVVAVLSNVTIFEKLDQLNKLLEALLLLLARLRQLILVSLMGFLTEIA